MFKTASTKLFDFSDISVKSSTVDEIDSHEIKQIKSKLTAIKESYKFAKEVGDKKHTQDKLELITKL